MPTNYSLTPDSTTRAEANTSITFTVTRSGSPLPIETLYASTLSDTATSGAGDYFGLVNQPINFNSNQLTATFSVTLRDDSLVENTEHFRVMIARNQSDGSAQALDISDIFIQDNDTAALPSLSVNDISVNENSGTATFTVSLSAASSQTVSVLYSTLVGSANAGGANTDYNGVVNQTLTFTPGQTSKSVTINLINDSIPEGTEFFDLLLESPTNATISDSTGRATILDTDTAALPSLSVNDISVNENSGTATFTVSLSAASSQTVSVLYSTLVGSANAGGANTDYNGVVNQTLTFTPGQTSKSVTINLVNDSIPEGTEFFDLLLESPTNATISDSTGRATILDTDTAALPSLSVNDITVNENTGTATFTVSLSAASSQTVSVLYSTLFGTANPGGAVTDYNGVVNQTLTFTPGQTSKSVTINLINDSIPEGTEFFDLLLESPTNATISDSTGRATILDTDTTPLPSLSVNDISVNENSGTATFTVSLSAASSQTVSVLYSTLFGTANPGGAVTDYNGVVNQTLTFTPGQTSKSVTINLINDSIPEGTEFFDLLLESPTNATISDSTGRATILDADTADTVPGTTSTTVNLTAGQWLSGKIDGAGLDGLAGDKDYYKVGLTAGHLYKFEGDASVSTSDTLNDIVIRLRDGNGNTLPVDKAANGAAPSFTFTPTTSGTYVLAVSADGVGDTWKAKTGDFQAKFTDVGTASTYSFGTSNKVVGESDGTVSFTLTRTNTVGNETVYVTTWQNWNGNGDYNFGDYTPKPGTNVTFLDGSTTATAPITVLITPDLSPEATQTFGLIATKTPGAMLSDAIATTSFTITDDDAVALAPGALWTGTAQQIFSVEGHDELVFLGNLSSAAYGSNNNSSYDVVNSHLKLLNEGSSDVTGINVAGGIYTNDRAAALVGRSADALFIAFRGTDNFGEDIHFSSNLSNVFQEHYTLFKPLFVSLNDYLDSTNGATINKIYVTGHSLGAAMTQAFIEDDSFSGKLSSLAVEAVAFANPGYGGVFSNEVPRGPLLNIGVESDVVANLSRLGRYASGDSNTIHGDLHPTYVEVQNPVSHRIALYIEYAKLLQQAGIDVSHLQSLNGFDYDSIIANALIQKNGGYSFLAGDGSDNLMGTSGRDIILGGDGEDTLHAGLFVSGVGFIGSGAEDRLYGGAGNDTYHFYSNSSHNTIIESSGSDTIVLPAGTTFAISRHGVDVWITYGAGGWQSSKITISNYDARPVENIKVGIGAAETISSLLSLRDHPVDLNAASVTAQVSGSSYNASNVFGVGLDANLPSGTAIFRGAWNPFASNGGNFSGAPLFAEANSDGIDGTTQAINGFRDLIGTELGDRLVGDGQANILYGGAGDDLVQAGGGTDSIIGGDGHGNDTYDGGDDIDTLTYSSTQLGVMVNLTLAQDQATGSEIGTDQILNVENIIGGSGNDQIIGDANSNNFFGGAGNDILNGGLGTDTALFSGTRSDYFIRTSLDGLSRQIIDLRDGAPEGTDIVVNLEILQFSDSAIYTDFTRYQDIYSMPGWNSLSGDFNGDGTTDLLWNSGAAGILGTWLMEDGAISDGYALNYNMPGWSALAGDFNGDGTDDLLWNSGADGILGTWLMKDGKISDGFALNYNMPGWKALVGDFNGDGTDDLLWNSGEAGILGTWLMKDGKISDGYALNYNMPGWSALVGDFNGDGTDDLLWKNDRAGTLGTWLMKDGKIFDGFALNHDMPGWNASVGDFNGDGTDDLLWRNDLGATGAWLMKDGKINGGIDAGLTADWSPISQGDFDQNGTDDVLWQNQDGVVSTWLLF